MNLSEGYNILVYATIASILIPLVISFVRRKTLNKSLRVLALYLCVCLIADLLILSPDANLQNRILNLFTVVEEVFICYIYFIETDNPLLRKFIIGINLLFLIVAVLQFTVLSRLENDDIIVCSIEAGIIILFSYIYIVKLLTAPYGLNLKDYYLFWLVLANLAYFSTAQIFFMFGHFIQRAPFNHAVLLWGLHDVINIGCYILYAIGIWKTQKK